MGAKPQDGTLSYFSQQYSGIYFRRTVAKIFGRSSIHPSIIIHHRQQTAEIKHSRREDEKTTTQQIPTQTPSGQLTNSITIMNSQLKLLCVSVLAALLVQVPFAQASPLSGERRPQSLALAVFGTRRWSPVFRKSALAQRQQQSLLQIRGGDIQYVSSMMYLASFVSYHSFIHSFIRVSTASHTPITFPSFPTLFTTINNKYTAIIVGGTRHYSERFHVQISGH